MQITLVYGAMAMGGIETLIVRVANLLAHGGRSVQVICQEGVLRRDFVASVDVIIYADWADARRRFQASRAGAGRRLMISFDPTSCALANWLEGSSGQAVTHVTGVFHPRAYFLEKDWLRLLLNRLLLKTIADERIFFMNDDTRSSHASWASRDFSRSPVLPIGIRIHSDAYSPKDRKPVRIVSVGRLADFKDFNLLMPAIVNRLRASGDEVEWHVFGSGELGPALAEEIATTATGEWIKPSDVLPYADFGKVVGAFDIFVGMGTAALEAATLGLPTIVAIDRGGDRTYGFLQDLPFGNVGETMDQSPIRTIEDLLIELLAGGREVRSRVGAESRQAALLYSMEDYASGLVAIGERATARSRLVARAAGWLYGQATVGRTRRAVQAVRRLVRK